MSQIKTHVTLEAGYRSPVIAVAVGVEALNESAGTDHRIEETDHVVEAVTDIVKTGTVDHLRHDVEVEAPVVGNGETKMISLQYKS